MRPYRQGKPVYTGLRKGDKGVAMALAIAALAAFFIGILQKRG